MESSKSASREDALRSPTATPAWVREIFSHYNSQIASQFLLSGNIHDLFSPGQGESQEFISLSEHLGRVVVPRFDVVLSYDIGNGVRAERGGELLARWTDRAPWPESKNARQSMERITQLLRYLVNLRSLGQQGLKIAVVLKEAGLFAGAEDRREETHAAAFLIREWSREPQFRNLDQASFLLTENLNDLHPLLRENTHASRILIPPPSPREIAGVLHAHRTLYPTALELLAPDLDAAGEQLRGSTLSQVLRLLKLREHENSPLAFQELSKRQSEFVARECGGMVEILGSNASLDDWFGPEALKDRLRGDIKLWNRGVDRLMPMGYLVSGPVGTGKTFLIKCLAGEARIPVVVVKNFRDKWYGSTEGNLEKIFRTIKALGRCYVFVDEADQTLGRRDSGASEPGVSGRIYSMIAQEMSDKANRGRIVWILATSRPDLLEVDLKRPGRIDLKIPLLPTATPAESWSLLQSLARAHGIPKDELPAEPGTLEAMMPSWMTAGEIDALLTDLCRRRETTGQTAAALLASTMENYLRPIPLETIEFQAKLALTECTHREFIPKGFEPEPRGVRGES